MPRKEKSVTMLRKEFVVAVRSRQKQKRVLRPDVPTAHYYPMRRIKSTGYLTFQG